MAPPHTLLIVDADAGMRAWLEAFAARLGYAAVSAASVEAALLRVRARRPDVAVLDLGLPGPGGLAALQALRALEPRLPVIMLSAEADTAAIVAAIRLGALDFLRKPFEPAELAAAISKAGGAPARPLLPRTLRPPEPPREVEIGFPVCGPRMRVVADMIRQVADTDVTVLIRGESGTGKELVARAVYAHSTRAERAFVKVNCAALPSELLESELFGYERGAFTGAEKRKLGRFELASSGTIFLDEISEMSPALQAKLLQVLQDGHFSRLGGEVDVSVDARVIAASNKNLEVAVRAGSFREDLFYRLNVVTIHLPPLRERRDDIAPLFEYFATRYAAEYGRSKLALPDDVARAFSEYDWPGNIRELENLVKRMVVLDDARPVLFELRARAAAAPAPSETAAARTELERFLAGQSSRVNLKRVAREAAQVAEARLIAKVLERTRWNRKEAASMLQISYKALLYKMKDAGLAGSP